MHPPTTGRLDALQGALQCRVRRLEHAQELQEQTIDQLRRKINQLCDQLDCQRQECSDTFDSISALRVQPNSNVRCQVTGEQNLGLPMDTVNHIDGYAMRSCPSPDLPSAIRSRYCCGTLYG